MLSRLDRQSAERPPLTEARMDTALHDALLRAHEAQDKAALVTLYRQAGEASAEVDEACFFFTNAYIFALDTGSGEAAALEEVLRRYGRV